MKTESEKIIEETEVSRPPAKVSGETELRLIFGEIEAKMQLQEDDLKISFD